MSTQSQDIGYSSERSARAVADQREMTGPYPLPVIADPVGLGLSGFGITTLVLSIVNSSLIPTSTTLAVLALAVTFGGTAQFLAGMWAFAKGETFPAVAFSSYGAFWWSFYLLEAVFIPMSAKAGASAGDINVFVGIYLMAWGIFTAYMTLASLRTSMAVVVIFVTLVATYFLLAFGVWTAHTEIFKIGGYVGMTCACAALYTAWAHVVNATWKRVVLPTGPLGI